MSNGQPWADKAEQAILAQASAAARVKPDVAKKADVVVSSALRTVPTRALFDILDAGRPLKEPVRTTRSALTVHY